MNGVLGGRLTRAHHAVDGHARCKLVRGLIGSQGLREISTLVEFIGVDALQIMDACTSEFLQQHFGQLVVGLGNDLAGFAIDDVLGDHATDHEVFRHADVRCATLFKLTGVTNGHTLVFGHNHFARLVGDVKTGHFTAKSLRDELHLRARIHQLKMVVDEEVRQNALRGQANGFEQNRDRHFPAAIHPEVKHVFGIELKIEP